MSNVDIIYTYMYYHTCNLYHKLFVLISFHGFLVSQQKIGSGQIFILMLIQYGIYRLGKIYVI